METIVVALQYLQPHAYVLSHSLAYICTFYVELDLRLIFWGGK